MERRWQQRLEKGRHLTIKSNQGIFHLLAHLNLLLDVQNEWLQSYHFGCLIFCTIDDFVRNDGKETAKNSKIKPQETRGFNVENPSNVKRKNHGRQPATLHYIRCVFTMPSCGLQEELSIEERTLKSI